MPIRQRYRALMEWLYLACIVLSGSAMVAITPIIPLGVVMRYAMNDPLSWLAPASVVVMVMFSFLGGAAVYRANVHIAVEALMRAVAPDLRQAMKWGVNACMGATALFMLGYGVHLCIITQFQPMAGFPGLSVAIVYAPIPLICAPIFMPVILNLGIGLITPPVGPTLFVGCAIGTVTMEEVSVQLWPFYAAMCFALLLVTYIPAISLWLPGLTK